MSAGHELYSRPQVSNVDEHSRGIAADVHDDGTVTVDVSAVLGLPAYVSGSPDGMSAEQIVLERQNLVKHHHNYAADEVEDIRLYVESAGQQAGDVIDEEFRHNVRPRPRASRSHAHAHAHAHAALARRSAVSSSTPWGRLRRLRCASPAPTTSSGWTSTGPTRRTAGC